MSVRREPPALADYSDLSRAAEPASEPQSAQARHRGVAGVLLAAGEGSRFAGSLHKLRAPFRGRPLVCWAADAALGAQLAAVYVVLGAEDLSDLLPPEVTVVCNHDWERGQAWSLQAGVRTAERDGHAAVVVGVADQPLVGAEAWRRVAGTPGTVVTAVYGARRRPPVKLDASVWPLLPLDGDEGARQLMRRYPETVRQAPCPGDPTDIDTIEDLRHHNR
ncbi:MAG: nucleotidyltransferase family protein [Acidimicrobiia bacterium]|nr:nucleotidyltransferase family protein [Acidimicrobiia bacterium]MXZ31018.1 nucleotidyltransferase family protein [Acidimicrobiia bacterium]MYJ14852.1 nucleotidyltransferase family protein [Acidimicrobiia bacterium]